jgi:hypothetical protein
VHFKPSGSKPVFCRECFQGKRRFEGPRNENFPKPGNFPPPPPPHKAEFEALNAKLDKILKLLATEDPIKEIEEVIKVKAPVVKKKKASKK